MPDSASCPARGPYLPRRPQTSPLYRVPADHFAALERVHEERFEPSHGPLRAVLGEFVRHGGLEEDAAAGMLAWPQSGFGAHIGPRIEEREGLLRVARYSARAPVAESRLRYDAERAEVELVADCNAGPYAGGIG